MHFAKENLGIVVRKARKNRKLTQQQLADCLGMSLRSIIDVENGRSNLKFDSLYELVRFLHIPGKYIFYHQEHPISESITHSEAIRKRLIAQIEECSEDELSLIDGICTATLSVYRSSKFTPAALKTDSK